MKRGRIKTEIWNKPFDMKLLGLYFLPTYIGKLEHNPKSVNWQKINRATKRLLKIKLIKKYPALSNRQKYYIITKKGKKLLIVYNIYYALGEKCRQIILK